MLTLHDARTGCGLTQKDALLREKIVCKIGRFAAARMITASEFALTIARSRVQGQSACITAGGHWAGSAALSIKDGSVREFSYKNRLRANKKRLFFFDKKLPKLQRPVCVICDISWGCMAAQ